MKTLSLFFAISLFAAGNAMCQDTILTLEGDEIVTPDYRYDESSFEIEYKTPKLSIKSINTDEVFGIKHQDGTERIFYKYDPAEGNGLTVEDMREMATGMSCARVNHREPAAFVVGFCAGFGGVFLMPVVKGNLLYAPLVPLVAVSITGMTRVNAAKHTSKIYGRDMSEMFNSGYADRAKRKRMSSVIFGSLVGLASGVLINAAAQ